jgi:hypothetical protein
MAEVRYLGIFPFCFTSTNDASLVGDGTFYPLGFSKEEVCALYWKNKSYNIACTDVGSVTYGGTETIPWEFGRTGVADYVAGSNFFTPTIETDFICADVESKTIGWFENPVTNNEGAVYLFGYDAWNAFGYSLTTNCYYYNNQYYPLIVLTGGLGYSSVSNWATTTTSWTQAQVDLISVTATCTFLGRNVPVYFSGFIAPTLDGQPITSGTVSGSLVITLDTQWPYDP